MTEQWNSKSKFLSQHDSVTTLVTLWYSTSTLNWDKVGCRFNSKRLSMKEGERCRPSVGVPLIIILWMIRFKTFICFVCGMREKTHLLNDIKIYGIVNVNYCKAPSRLLYLVGSWYGLSKDSLGFTFVSTGLVDGFQEDMHARSFISLTC